jgi:hypothetical protein
MHASRSWSRLAWALGLAALLAIPASALAAGGRSYSLALSGANEFNAAGAPINPHGDSDRGTAVITLNVGREEVCWSFGPITLTTGDALPHVAHIHFGPAGVAGPVVVDLFGGSAPAAPTAYPTGTTCVPAAREVLLAILRNPEAYYINLHNAEHPGGVMRAQFSD